MQRTLAILKTDCTSRNLIGKVIARIEESGFKILGMKMIRLSKAAAGEFYAVHKERPFYSELCNFMSDGTVVPIALEKENAVADFRKLIGATNPEEAEPGTIRREFAASLQNNIVHGSDSMENGKLEISFFFSEKELVDNA